MREGILWDLLGRVQLAAGEKEDARSTYIKLATVTPKSAYAHFTLATVHAAMADEKATRIALRKALELKPDEADLYVFIGSLQASQKLYAEAEKTFNKMIDSLRQSRDEIEQYNRNLEEKVGVTVLDRTAVILDIFGQNAHTLEGKAQVELALLRYRLPRLRRGAGQPHRHRAGHLGRCQGRPAEPDP